VLSPPKRWQLGKQSILRGGSIIEGGRRGETLVWRLFYFLGEEVFMRTVFKIALLKEFDTQANAAKVLEIKAPNLSALVRGHRDATPGERVKLRRVFSDYQLRKFSHRCKLQKCKAWRLLSTNRKKCEAPVVRLRALQRKEIIVADDQHHRSRQKSTKSKTPLTKRIARQAARGRQGAPQKTVQYREAHRKFTNSNWLNSKQKEPTREEPLYVSAIIFSNLFHRSGREFIK
jgi:hypothetical protein